MIELHNKYQPQNHQEQHGVPPLVLLGQPMLSMLIGPILFRRALEEVSPPGYDASFWQWFPNRATDLYLDGDIKRNTP